jgi:hypothetical protein
MRRASQLPKDALDPSVVTTTRHMADAVSFLIRVASDAGLRNIANNLSTVRVHLLDVASKRTHEQDLEKNSEQAIVLPGSSKDSPHEKRKIR